VLAGVVGLVGTWIMFSSVGMALVGAINALRDSWRETLRTAMVIPALIYVAVQVVATIGSVFPRASLHGGYVRQQGTLTVLAYVGLFFVLAFNLRRREQLERLITVVLLASIPAALYGIVQKFGIDPLPWQGNVERRVASTMGNAIFIAAYLIMILPLTGYRFLSAWNRVRHSPPPDETSASERGIRGPVYRGVLWGAVGLALSAIFFFAPIVLAVRKRAMEQDPTAQAKEIAAIWPDFWHNVLLFVVVALLTLAVPALLYTLLAFFRDKWRPYAHLVALGICLGGASILLLYPGTQVNGFAWAGYLVGLCGLALLSRWQHQRKPWGGDALWTDAVYILLVVQSLFLFMVIKAYLPDSPYPSKWPLYLVALILYFGSLYIPAAARIRGRVGYLAQAGGYVLLAGLQLTCIVLTQSRGPLTGLLAGLMTFVLLTLIVVAKNARRGEAEGRLSPGQVVWLICVLVLMPLLLVFALFALLARAGKRPLVFLRTLCVSPRDAGRAAGFTLLLLLNIASFVLLGAGGVTLGRASAGQAPLFLGLGAVGLIASAVITGVVLFGPGLPKSPKQWLWASLATLFSGVGLFVAMVSVKRGRRWLWLSVVFVFVLVIVGVAVFNLPNTPLLGRVVEGSPGMASFVEEYIEPLKDIPYLGRLGKIFDTASGTGKVRILIWFGDDIGTGSAGMITAHPLRTLIGYGPESMHVGYNPYYPPELAHVERRNASPDRAHNAVIDELVTIGTLGLAGYLLYFGAFFVLVWQILWRSPNVRNQAFAVGLLSLGVAHFVETVTGIPIVATRMYMWLAIGVAVALHLMPPFRQRDAQVATVEQSQEMQTRGSRSRRRRGGRRGRRKQGVPGGWGLLYGVVILGALVFAYRANIKPMRADIFFWRSDRMQAHSKFLQQQAAAVSDQTVAQQYLADSSEAAEDGLRSLHQAIALVPGEDFFYLSLAQVYLAQAQANLAQAQQAQGAGAQEFLLRADDFFLSTERTIIRARDLSPLNTDHYRNLSVSFGAWFRASFQADHIARSIAYAEQAVSLSRNNANLRDHLVQTYLTAAEADAAKEESVQELALNWLRNWPRYHLDSGGRAGDTHLPLAEKYREEALGLLENGRPRRALLVLAAAELQYALFLDDQYPITYLLLGDLYRQMDMPTESALTYGAGVRYDLTLLNDSLFGARIQYLKGAGELETLRRAYLDIAAEREARLQGSVTESQELRLHQRVAQAYRALGYLSIVEEDLATAIEYYEISVSHRENTEAYRYLAILYNNLGQTDQALEYAHDGLRVARERNRAQEVQDFDQLIQEIQQQQGQLSEAEARVANNPEDYLAQFDLAGLYRDDGRMEEAFLHAQLAAQYVPMDQPEEVYRVYLRLANFAYILERFDVAETAYKQVIQVQEDHYHSLNRLALILYEQNRLEDALSYAEIALQFANENRLDEAQSLVDELRQALGEGP
jgi:tetratricopeptide (TPR) repeat protein/O-antigen ligase